MILKLHGILLRILTDRQERASPEQSWWKTHRDPADLGGRFLAVCLQSLPSFRSKCQSLLQLGFLEATLQSLTSETTSWSPMELLLVEVSIHKAAIFLVLSQMQVIERKGLDSPRLEKLPLGYRYNGCNVHEFEAAPLAVCFISRILDTGCRNSTRLSICLGSA